MFKLRYGKLINRNTYEEIDLEREFPDEVPVFKAFLLLQEEVKMLQDGMNQKNHLKQQATERLESVIKQLQDERNELTNSLADVSALAERIDRCKAVAEKELEEVLKQ